MPAGVRTTVVKQAVNRIEGRCPGALRSQHQEEYK